MSAGASERDGLARLLGLVAREDEHLLAVRRRLLGGMGALDAGRAEALLNDDLGVDRLESFGAKFSRMQDTVIDKLAPALLRAAGEPVAAAIDNLARMERLGLIAAAESWLEMRRLRNRLIHEYIERPGDLAAALERASRFTDAMHDDYVRIRDYAREHLGVES